MIASTRLNQRPIEAHLIAFQPQNLDVVWRCHLIIDKARFIVIPFPAASPKVPFHSLGISQILSYGCLFYAFAQLKIPLAAQIGVAPSDILAAVTGALLIQAFLAPLIGGWIDKYGALTIMTRGLMLGAVGMALLPAVNALWWVWLCICLLYTSPSPRDRTRSRMPSSA